MIFSTVKALEIAQNKANFDIHFWKILPNFNHFLGSITELCKTINIIFFWFSLILIYRFFTVLAKWIPPVNHLLTRMR